MNEMNPSYDNRDSNNREYRDYRDYGDYRDYDSDRNNRDYNNRDQYGRNRRNYRTNYREDKEMIEDLTECMKDGMCGYKKYEMLAEQTEDRNEKGKLMKMAEREKEHYKTIKEMLENRM
jgi:hypothetical protein